ncbi:MAG: Flp1 family type IVb pilin [Lachnospiraceae bacterium]
MREWKEFLKEEDGMGTVEIIMIIAVLITLVMLFSSKASSLIKSWFKLIESKATSNGLWK